MADLSKLSDHDLTLISQGKINRVSDAALEALASGEEEISPEPTADADAAPRAKTDKAEAFIEGVGQTGTLGYLPQLQAAGSYLADKFAGAGKEVELPSGEIIKDRTPEESYVSRRDANIARQGYQAEDFPKAVMAGKALGLAPSVLAGPAGAGWKTGAALAGAESALYNPGDIEGKVNPAQLEERIKAGAIALPFGALGGAVSKAADKGKEIREMIRDVKVPLRLQKKVSERIQNALKLLDSDYISPRADQARKLVSGKSIEVNPDIIERAGFENLAKSMRGKAYGPATPSQIRVPIEGERALRLRQALDSVADYSKRRSALDPSAIAKNERAQLAADVVRRKISDVAPGIDQINQDLSEAIRLRNAIREQAKTPITAVSGRELSDKGAQLGRLDELSGSNLTGTAQKIKSASNLLLEPRRLATVLGAPDEFRKIISRGAVEASPGISLLTDRAAPITIGALLELAREKK